MEKHTEKPDKNCGSAVMTGYAFVVAVQYPDGSRIADKLITAGKSVLFAGAHPAHLSGIANLIRCSKGLFTAVIVDESNAHFFVGLDVDIVINKRDIAVAA